MKNLMDDLILNGRNGFVLFPFKIKLNLIILGFKKLSALVVLAVVV
jgi:hypothetical protein